MRKANPLLAAMKTSQLEPEQEDSVSSFALSSAQPAAKSVAKRAGQKHLGAYFDRRDPILERVAILRARLDMTNSELVEHALNELWKRHEAGRG